MGNLIKMDLYRMNKARSFRVCLILAFILGLLSTPLEKAMYALGSLLSSDESLVFAPTASLSDMIAQPVSALIYMLALLSVVSFFYADIEGGYIKNIAGQMPKKGFTVLSRYLAAIPHNLAFLVFGFAGNVIGTLLFRKIVGGGAIPESVVIFLLRLLLLQGICAILLLFVTTMRNKSMGVVLAVLFGLPVMFLIYMAINSGLRQIFSNVDITPYMPDQVLQEVRPDKLRALLVSLVTTGVFLPLSIHIFDKRDVR